jgi:DNA polymerase delta subunit 3
MTYHMSSEDDDSDDDESEGVVAQPAPTRQSEARAERQAKLRAMMDEEDSPVDADGDAAMEEAPEDPEVVVVDESATLDGASAASARKEDKERDVTTAGGKRRGKRRVMKKKTFVDEDGYLVTREEAEWESFEEDEPVEVKRPKVELPATQGKRKSGASGGKQGNIMSFFGKR